MIAQWAVLSQSGSRSLNSPRVGNAGCKVLGITISKEQLVEAQARVQAAGLKHLVDLRFCDYRQLPNAQGFDRVVSIEMIEAVRRQCGCLGEGRLMQRLRNSPPREKGTGIEGPASD